MKFILKEKPKNDSVKIKNKFLIFPKKIGSEIRWLEKVKIKYLYEVDYAFNGDKLSHWIAIKFIDD